MGRQCLKCQGSGAISCPMCEGTGLDPNASTREGLDAPECNYCDGLAEIPCPDCGGAGEVE